MNLENAADTAVLLVGHGTRRTSGQDEFRDLYKTFAECLGPIHSELAFLELASPSIAEAIERLAANTSIRRLLVVPVLLFTAGHALDDIPSAVITALKGTSIELIGQTEALECTPEVLQLSASRFQEAICSGACQNKCSGEVCSKTMLVLVGRGSNSDAAAQKMREFCLRRQQWTSVRHATAAFIYGQSPTVAEAFETAASSDAEFVVVQPHLLFSGLLLDELTEQVQEAGKQNSKQRWVITQGLGADRKLAELLADRARSQIV